MRKIILALVFACCTNVSIAHNGPHLPNTSIFSKDYKYRINTENSHIGHFYIKKARVSTSGNENLRIEHTIHLEEDVVKKFKIAYKEKSSMISYKFNMEDRIYFFNFYIFEDPLNNSNPGTMAIFDKATNSFTIENVTLDPLLEAEEDISTESGDGHMHS